MANGIKVGGNQQVSADETEPKGQSLDFSGSRAAKKQHDQIVSWTKDQFMSTKSARAIIERQWYMNLSFYMGKQHVVFRSASSSAGSVNTTKLWVPPAPYYRSRPTINVLRPIIRTELAQLTNNKPTASVIPASADERDMYAALAGEQIWDYLYGENKLKFIFRRALWWTLTCGTGFVKTYFDPSQGPWVDGQGQPLDRSSVPPGVSPVELGATRQGKICYTPETPFHILVPDLREEEIENQPFVIHAQLRSAEYVHMNFKKGIDGEEININGGPGTSDLIDESYLNLIGSVDSSRKQSNVLVFEVWVKPDMLPMFPEGAMFTIVGDKIVQGMGQLPYSHGKYPYSKFDHIPTGRFYSASSLEDLIPLQKEYNRTRGQIIEAKNRMAKPQFLAARGSVDFSKITTEPGLGIEYTPGFPEPKQMPMVPLPSYVITELERIRADINDISGQHEITHGQVPPGVTAATAISYLQERDETKLSPTFDSLEEGIEKIAFMSLNLVKDYWDTPQVIKVTSPDGSFDAMAFTGSDLKDNTDIKIEAGSSLPTSKAAKQALVMDLMKMGFITPQQGLQVLDMGGINKLYEQIQTDQRQAQRENLRMSKVTPEILAEYQQMVQQQEMQAQMQTDPSIQQMGGQPPMGADPSMQMGSPSVSPSMDMNAPSAPEAIPLIVPVNTWDNHPAHIEFHNRYRKGQAFETLAEDVKAIFEQHVQMHIQAMGLETVTMDPRQAAGLPPLPPGEGPSVGQPGGSPPPGPEPMPGNQIGGQ